jgi:hypothetical protein
VPVTAYSKCSEAWRILRILTCCRNHTIIVGNDVGNDVGNLFFVDKDFEDLLRAASPFFVAKFDQHEQIITLPK